MVGIIQTRPAIMVHNLRFLRFYETEQLSSAEESHPHALSDPDVRLSPHPAPTVQSQVLYQTTLPYP